MDSDATKYTQTGVEKKHLILTDALVLSLSTPVTLGRLWKFSEP